MIMNEDYRYIASKYKQMEEISGFSYGDLFGNDTVLGRWLRSSPAVIKVNKSLICHAGISPMVANKYDDWTDINNDFWNLTDNGYNSDPKNLLLRSFGPFWYRGYFQPVQDTPQMDYPTFNEILKQWNLSEIIVGHTTQDSVISSYKGKMFAVDAGMKRGISGEALLFEFNHFFKINHLGKKIKFQEK